MLARVHGGGERSSLLPSVGRARDPSSPSRRFSQFPGSPENFAGKRQAAAAAAAGGGDGGSAIIYEVGRLRVGETVPSARPSHPLPYSPFVCLCV